MKTWGGRFWVLKHFFSWRFSVSRELFSNKLENGNKQYCVFGAGIEQDATDPELKVWFFILFGISFSIGILKTQMVKT